MGKVDTLQISDVLRYKGCVKCTKSSCLEVIVLQMRSSSIYFFEKNNSLPYSRIHVSDMSLSAISLCSQTYRIFVPFLISFPLKSVISFIKMGISLNFIQICGSTLKRSETFRKWTPKSCLIHIKNTRSLF